MMRALSLPLAVVLVWAAVPHAIAADLQPSVKRRLTAESKPSTAVEKAERGRTIYENAPFPFNWSTSGMPYGWYHVKFDGKLHVVYDPKKPDALEFRFVRDEVPIILLTGHRWSSFTTWENILLFTDYRPTAPGCAVEGYDLEDGKRLWRTELTVAGPGSPTVKDGTKYSTRAALRSDHGVIELIVEETAGQYLEILDPQTGQSRERRVYERRIPATTQSEQKPSRVGRGTRPTPMGGWSRSIKSSSVRETHHVDSTFQPSHGVFHARAGLGRRRQSSRVRETHHIAIDKSRPMMTHSSW